MCTHKQMTQSDYEVNVVPDSKRGKTDACAHGAIGLYGSYYGLVETLLRDFLANHMAQQSKPTQKQNYSPLLIDTPFSSPCLLITFSSFSEVCQ